MVLLLAAQVGGQTDAVDEADGPLAWRVYQVFQRHCTECHGGHLENPKSGFGFVLDLERLKGNEEFVIPGDPEASEIYLLLTDPDPDFRMPPADSDVPAVSPKDAELVRRWIEEESPAGTDIAAAGSQAASSRVDYSMKRWIGHAHPLVVHFPIALLLVALAAGLAERFTAAEAGGIRTTMRWCLWLGALGAVAAAATGWVNAGYEGYAPDTVFRHRWLGVAVASLGILSAVVHDLARRRGKETRLAPLLLLLLAILAGLVAFTGHTGGTLVFGEDYFF